MSVSMGLSIVTLFIVGANLVYRGCPEAAAALWLVCLVIALREFEISQGRAA